MEAAKDPGVTAVSSRWDRLRAVADKMLKLKFTYKVAIALVTSGTAAYASVIWYCLAEGVPVFDLLEVAGPGIVLLSSITWFILTATALVLLMPGIMRLFDPGHRHPVANDTEEVVERRIHFRFLLAVVPGSIAYSLFVMPIYVARMNLPEMTPWLDGARWAFIVLMGSAWSKFALSARRSAGGQGVLQEARTGWMYFLVMNAITMAWMLLYTEVAIDLVVGFYDDLRRSQPGEVPWPARLPFVGLPMVPGFLLVISMGWASKRRAIDLILAVAGGVICCGFFWPTAPHVVERTLNLFSIGGGRVVALWIDESTACWRHPALLPEGACSSDMHKPGRIRLRPLPLALRGKDAYLLWLDDGPAPGEQTLDMRRTTISIPRTDIHEVEFLRNGSDLKMAPASNTAVSSQPQPVQASGTAH